jgi:hypothetical protein
MAWQNAAERCVVAAHRKLLIVRERLFPPTWVEALRQLKTAHGGPTAFSTTPRDLLHELLIPTPNGTHGDDPEEDFCTWFLYRHEFGKLLCLYDALSHVVVGLNLTEPSEPDFAAHFDIAARILDATGDHALSIVCLDVAAKTGDESDPK